MAPIEATFIGVIDGVPYVVLPFEPNKRHPVQGLVGGPFPAVDDRVLVDYADSGRLWYLRGPRSLPSASAGQGLLWDGTGWTTPDIATQAELTAAQSALAAVDTALDARLDTLENRVAAKGVRHTTFNVANAVPGTTIMPFESVPGGQAANQQYESHPGMLNTATGVITLPEDGVYDAEGFFTYSSALVTGGTTVSLVLYGDLFGTALQRVGEDRVATGGITPILTCGAMFKAEAGDTLHMAIGHNVGSTQASGAGNTNLPWYLAVYKVRNIP